MIRRAASLGHGLACIGLVLVALQGAAVSASPRTAGVKGQFAFEVLTSAHPVWPQTLVVTIDLSDVLNASDVQFGTRKPSELVSPSIIAWLPGEERPRAAQQLVRGNQPGRYVAHLRCGEGPSSGRCGGQGTARIDGKRADGSIVALQVPLLIELPGGANQAPQPSGTNNTASGTNNIARIVPPSLDPVSFGDESLGRVVYQQRCAGCHGSHVWGQDRAKEPGPALNRASVAFRLTLADWERHVWLEDAERASVMAYLAPFRPDLKKLVDEAWHYVHRDIDIDDAVQRKHRRLVPQVSPVAKVTLLPLYLLPESKRQDASPWLIPNQPRALEVAVKKARRGFAAVVETPGGLVGEWWIRLDNAFKVTAVLARDGHSQALPTPSAELLRAFVGEGGKGEDAIPLKARVQANDALAAQFAAAYLAVRQAALSYETEETDRSWAN